VFGYTDQNTKDPYFKVKPERWLDVAKLLRDDPELRFDFLQNVTAVDWIKQSQVQVVYHLYSYPKKHSCVVKADLPRDKPQISSVAGLWKAADWNEREQYDLFGVEFLAHPDLRRIMLPDDWPGHPMRKDYKEAESYRGMPTTRPNTLELLPMYDKAPPEQKEDQPGKEQRRGETSDG
jgi:NADH-quinone oxidoreductase subunit C